MAEMHLVKPEALQELAQRIFVAAGTPEDLATHVARHLVKANLSGHDSHGVIRIPRYVESIEQKSLAATARPEVVRDWPGAAVVDGKRGFGQVAASFALDVAIEKATKNGVGAASVRRCNHIGRLGDYSETAAERGYIAIVTYGSAGPNSGHAAPFGGAARHLGTNPWSIGIPGADVEPVIVDFATTVVAEGKIQVARAKHAPLPAGSIVDKEGQPSTEAEDFYAGGMILPMGGHKGYGLSLVAALIGAGLTAEEPATQGRGGGVFVLAINPRAFGESDVYGATIDNLAGAVKAVSPAPGFSEVMLPGGPEGKSRAERQKAGVPVPGDTWDALAATARRLQVPVPAVGG
ncbi:MAG: Ldh family oxidoreductase [Chloroflexota bacterium]|nr:Ldh family oxidoreductase [Chloroflexota bacterium]